MLLYKQMVPGTGGVPQFQRIPLPGTEFLEEEPLYVNAKQYRRILKRRQARAKLEAEGRIPKERPVRIFVTIFTIIVVGCNDAEI
jgi:nuclear transcription factor Y alpha